MTKRAASLQGSRSALEERLGHRFADPGLLERALTHRSFASDHNERLEFLGDGVLGCAIAQALLARFPDAPEGKLTQLRAGLVREEALAEVARGVGLEQHLRLGAVTAQPSILADAMEAVFGAVFLDAGYDAAREAIVRAYGMLLAQADPRGVTKDAKTRLQEHMQAAHEALPEYRVVGTRGEAHSRAFDVECRLPSRGLAATGSGSSRQRAEQEAARAMLDRLAG